MQELQQPRSQPLETSYPPFTNDPVIETERLRLRRHRPGDLEERIAITGDPEFMRFVGGAYDRQENWARILRYVGHWTLFGYGLLAVEERGSGRYVGDVGLAHFERGLGSDFDDAPEAAWMIAAWAGGRGYACEGMAAAIDWHQRRFGSTRQVCIVDPVNAGSLRVAQKLGFRTFRSGLNRGHEVLLHERISPGAS